MTVRNSNLSLLGNMNSKEQQIILNASQQAAFEKLKLFLAAPAPRAFVLKGYAGTGKTTLVKELVSYLKAKRISYALLASTGRAAKILRDLSGNEAETVHSFIYKYMDFNKNLDSLFDENGDVIEDEDSVYLRFGLNRNPLERKDVYIIDESSMISDRQTELITQAEFGTGKLLTDLFSFDMAGHFIFIGDSYQLPPINQEQSPALSPEYITNTFKIPVEEFALQQIMRQSAQNGIIGAAAIVRQRIDGAPEDPQGKYARNTWCSLPFRGSNDIILTPSQDTLARSYLQDIKDGDYTNASFICKTNRQCFEYSAKFRRALAFSGDPKPGELLLVTQNNYPTGLRNGDLVKIIEISSKEIHYAGLTFVNVTVEELFTKTTRSSLMIKQLPFESASNLDAANQKKLFVSFAIQMRKRKIKQYSDEFLKAMMDDPFLNALRTSFGYALTCHKAQGGEWNHVYALFPRNILLNPTKGSYQWIYTAVTRAKDKLYLVDDFYIQ